jgi:hypothetical protein
MDKSTRNAIERATQQARKLLDDDFSSQLEGTFDVLRSGVIAAKGGSHLSARQQFQRAKIVATIEHKRSAGTTAVEAVTDFVRDAAFTALNRFVALKMLEARQLVQECITKGERSAGFKEFCGMAPGIALLPDSAGYRLYVDSLFDEFSTEIKVLFDRRDAASVLWPKRQTFENVLSILNAPELLAVWGEDETIGWVYQFFNSGEERRKMRDESQAPRNSRELAVRNQFFTPRYVVQFLVDNTLGRLWQEMRGQKTRLSDICDYLVRPAAESILVRTPKDPRDLRILDPACGSGHFLLYSFDVLLAIYEEAWSDEGHSTPCEATGRSLREDYPDIAQLRRAAPSLIVEYNLHGVDIDPRCAQIAALALWLRAQRAWRDIGVLAAERPRIRRTHIVVAEPMPGDASLVDEFAERLEPPLLRDLFKKMVGESRQAGELGTLLRMENSISGELKRAREQFVKHSHATGYLPGMEPVLRQGLLDLSGIDEDGFFHEAEARIIRALHEFSDSAPGNVSVRRRLFAGDAAEGIAFIDLVRTKFDVVLMNPPFGAATVATYQKVVSEYPTAKADILAAFVERGRELAPGGYVGAITNRTCLFINSLSQWRRRILLSDTGIAFLADLGHGVLDGALVEAACYVIGPSAKGLARGFLSDKDKAVALRAAAADPSSWQQIDRALLRETESTAVAYWAPPQVIRLIVDSQNSEDAGLLARVGLQTSNDFRFLRLQWEVPPNEVNQFGWVPFAKGGEYSPYADIIHLAVNWFDNAREQKAFAIGHAEKTGSLRGNDATRDFEWQFKEGLTYSERTTSDISVRALPRGCIIGTSGPGIYSRDGNEILPALSYFSSSIFRQLLELSIGSGDAIHSGSAARHYTVGSIALSPFPEIKAGPDRDMLAQAAEGCVNATRRLLATEPVAPLPLRYSHLQAGLHHTLTDLSSAISNQRWADIGEILQESCRIEQIILSTFGAAPEFQSWVAEVCGVHPADRPTRKLPSADVAEMYRLNEEALIGRVSEIAGYSRAISKKTWYADRKVELLSAFYNANSQSVIQALRDADVRSYGEKEAAIDLLEFALGESLGDVNTTLAGESELDVFDNKWACCPRNANTGSGLLVDDPGHPLDIMPAVTKAIVGCGWPAENIFQDIEESLKIKSTRDFVSGQLFSIHISRFSRSRRKAPIYWQLATPSASYSVWLYVHALTSDTIFRIQNELLGPKLLHEARKLEELSIGTRDKATAAERKELAAQELYVEELRTLLDEVKRVAPLWSPNLHDGVILNFAPLWRLVPQQKPWQKELRAVWDSLCDGEYDWAHLAMRCWPERVVPKCVSDRSFAVAHGLEDILWRQDNDGNWKPRSTSPQSIQDLIEKRTSIAVNAALKGLAEATATTATRSRTRRSPQ